jgi:hypothetical protein
VVKHYAGGQIKRNGTGAACSTYGTEINVAHMIFGGETEERENMKYLCINGSVILKFVFNK